MNFTPASTTRQPEASPSLATSTNRTRPLARLLSSHIPRLGGNKTPLPQGATYCQGRRTPSICGTTVGQGAQPNPKIYAVPSDDAQVPTCCGIVLNSVSTRHPFSPKRVMCHASLRFISPLSRPSFYITRVPTNTCLELSFVATHSVVLTGHFLRYL